MQAFKIKDKRISMKKTVYIITANGKIFKGYSFGVEKDVVGELVFTTGMTGYIETLTDPSYFGQIVIQTFPLIGNYGIINADLESKKSYLSAYIVREKCDMPSNFRCEGTLEDFLVKNEIVAIYGVDTRELTKNVRETGVMNAKITFNEPEICDLSWYNVKNAVKSVTSENVEFFGDINNRHIVVWDFGAKQNIIRELVKRNCYVIKVTSFYTAEQILALNPDGLMLSNGPGDPEENIEIIENLKKLIGKLPIFGICLGHQLFALAVGGKTQKMKYGHRGANQPVKNLDSKRVYISSQNHGYEVLASSLEKIGTLSYINANDNTCEGMEYPELNAFTVQFHPEASAGPKDTSFLFDKFLKLTEEK
jgi:carbamoyl-phosphate synthase small subunit